MIEPSAGADRATLAFLCEAYQEDTAADEHGKPQERVYLKLHPRLAPIKAGVFPLVNKDGMPEIAQRLYLRLKKEFKDDDQFANELPRDSSYVEAPPPKKQ